MNKWLLFKAREFEDREDYSQFIWKQIKTSKYMDKLLKTQEYLDFMNDKTMIESETIWIEDYAYVFKR